jgi:hypothetical protein
MLHRTSTWWRALSVVLLGLATLPWPSAASASPASSFTVIHQSAVAQLSSRGTSRFDLTLRLSAARAGAVAQVTLYPRILTRSEIAPIVRGTGVAGPPSSTTGNFTLDCNAKRPMTLTISLYTGRPGRRAGRCSSRPARLRLACSAQACDGVYPLSYSVTSAGVTTTKWSMVAVQATHVYKPLRLVWITTLDPSARRHATRSAAVLSWLAHQSTTPFTLTADYRTLAQALNDPSTMAASWRDELSKALDSPLHRVVAAPPANIDFAGLVAANLSTQVALQLSLAGQLLESMTGRFADAPVVLSGAPSLSSLDALAGSGASDIVLPESDLAVAPSSTLTWGAPFHVEGAGSLSALATDGPLGALAVDPFIEPGRRAALTLATLAFLHFEEPNAPAVRSVVVEAPAAFTSVPFLNDLFAGLAHDPFVRASSLLPSFDSSLLATNGAPATRTLAPSTSSSWNQRNVATLQTLIGAVTSFAGAAQSPTLIDNLRVAMARAEITGNANTRQNALDNANAVLSAQLNQFSIDPSAITLAGPGTAVPITILSRAHYPVNAVVHLITNGLSLPRGTSYHVTLKSSTTPLRVPAVSGRGSSVTMQVLLTTPNGQVVLAEAAIQVHIAGASLAGYLLTLASLLVLGFWWWRTLRRRSKGRHAR